MQTGLFSAFSRRWTSRAEVLPYMSTAVHDINCPNCGAPTELPVSGNSVECPYCNTRIYLPRSVAQATPPENPHTVSWDPQQKKRVMRWVWIIVGITLAVTVIPPLCTIVMTLCVSLLTVLASLPR